MSDEVLIDALEEDTAIVAASLFFQKELLKEEEKIDLQRLVDVIVSDLMGPFSCLDFISWSDFYPMLKSCVKK